MKTNKKYVDAKKLCELVAEGKVNVGDCFGVTGSLYTQSATTEIAFDVLEGHSVDTIIVNDRIARINGDNIGEVRYMGAGNHAVMGTHKRGSKEYHKLLEGKI